jgi:imidazolonepropionase
MFDSLWKNLNIATMSEESGYGIINNAAIGITEGKISFIGEEALLPSENNCNYIHDGGGRWVLPAFIDCHTHLVYAGNRAEEFEKRLNGLSYAEIAKAGGGIQTTVKATREASEEELFELAMQRIKPLFREGVTTIEIKSGYGLDTESERKSLSVAQKIADETGLRVQKTFLGAHALPPEYLGRADDYIDLVCQMMGEFSAEGMIDTVDAFCENIAFTTAQVEKVFKKAKELGLPVKLHAEQLSNMGGAVLAAKYQALSADHLEYIDESGVKAMAEAGMMAVLLPGAFYYLREKTLPPIDLFRKHKVPMAIATDHNPGTSPVLSPLLMMNMACTLFRMTPEEALAGVTKNAARALGYQDICGSLEIGKMAEFSFWDITHPRDLAYGIAISACTGLAMGGNYFDFVE